VVAHLPPSLTKLNDFCVIGPTNLRAINVLWAFKIKEQRKKRMHIVCFNFFGKK
jgi:hypothetical protein